MYALYNIQVLDLKNTKVGATHVMNDDGSYTIFVNSRMSREKQEICYLHEIEHIKNEDLHAYLDADSIEYMRHEME